MWWVVAGIVTALIFVYVWLSGEESAGEAAYEGALGLGILALSWFLSRRINAWIERRRSHRT
jgi:MYXO-CTERM domain-containing protein